MYDFKLSKVAALGRGCLGTLSWFVFIFSLLAKACGILVLEQEQNLAPLQYKCVALITAPLQESP